MGAIDTSIPAATAQPLSPGNVFMPHWIALWVPLIAGSIAAVVTVHLVPAVVGRVVFIDPHRSSTSIKIAVFAVGLKLNVPHDCPPLSTVTPPPSSLRGGGR